MNSKLTVHPNVEILPGIVSLCILLAAAVALSSCSGEGNDSGLDAAITSAIDADSDPSPSADCDNLPAGPFAPMEFVTGLGAAEDIAFDGLGRFVAAGQSGLVRVDPDGNSVPFAVQSPPEFIAGMRYAAGGHLIALEFLAGNVIAIDPEGKTTALAIKLQNPNAVAPTRDGSLFVSETAGNRIVRIEANREPSIIADGELTQAANGVVFDERRRVLYFAAGLGESVMTIGRVDFAADGTPSAPRQVYVGDPGNGDGIALDACGHLYIVDNFRAGSADQRRVIRLRLDPAGDAVGEPETIAEFPTSVTNPVFGAGPGFAATSLYVTGFAGIVYRVDVGIPGAPTPVNP